MRDKGRIVCFSALIASVVSVEYGLMKIFLLQHTFHLTLITVKILNSAL